MYNNQGHDRKYTLLGILQSYAPDRNAQIRCTEMYNKAIADGASDADVEMALIGAMGDGLKYDNWPWNI